MFREKPRVFHTPVCILLFGFPSRVGSVGVTFAWKTFSSLVHPLTEFSELRLVESYAANEDRAPERQNVFASACGIFSVARERIEVSISAAFLFQVSQNLTVEHTRHVSQTSSYLPARRLRRLFLQVSVAQSWSHPTAQHQTSIPRSLRAMLEAAGSKLLWGYSLVRCPIHPPTVVPRMSVLLCYAREFDHAPAQSTHLK